MPDYNGFIFRHILDAIPQYSTWRDYKVIQRPSLQGKPPFYIERMEDFKNVSSLYKIRGKSGCYAYTLYGRMTDPIFITVYSTNAYDAKLEQKTATYQNENYKIITSYQGNK